MQFVLKESNRQMERQLGLPLRNWPNGEALLLRGGRGINETKADRNLSKEINPIFR